jgi:hypothetical protein
MVKAISVCAIPHTAWSAHLTKGTLAYDGQVMQKRVQIFHLVSHFDNHHRREKDPGANIRHLLHPLAPDLVTSYPGGATVNVIELGLLADEALVTGNTLAEAKPYAAVRRTEIPA